MAVAVLRVVRVLIMIDLGVVWVLLTLFRILIAVLVLKTGVWFLSLYMMGVKVRKNTSGSFLIFKIILINVVAIKNRHYS